MTDTQRVVKASFLMGLIALATGCIVAEPREPREGYYEREHHRYYREHAWHECHEHDEYCR
jgi:hypothetical protein